MMKSWLKKILLLVTGNPELFRLEHRNLNGSLFVALTAAITCVLFNLFANFPIYYDFAIILSVFIFLTLFYFSRIRGVTRYLSSIFLVTSLSILSFAWFFSQGIEGSTPFFIVFIAFVTLISVKTRYHVLVISIFNVVSISLILIQYFYPSLIVAYNSKTDQFIDLSLSLIVSMLFSTYLLASIKRSYENERTKSELQKIEIEKQSLVIQVKNAELEEMQKEINAQHEKILLQKNQLEQINHTLMEADELKSRFFANISHEFRTPLTLIIGPLESLCEKTTDKKLAGEYSQMLNQAERLLLLINQLLDISKIEKGMMQLRVCQVQLNAVIRTIFSSFESFAAERNISFVFFEEHKDVIGYFDIDKLEKILYNLLSNAFKFTRNGGRIEIVLAQKDLVGEIVVKDDGIGIASDKIINIFDRFYQIDGGESRKFEGTGIGLALVKELVSLHHGTIEVKSEFNKGSEFVVRIPLDKLFYVQDNIVDKVEAEPVQKRLNGFSHDMEIETPVQTESVFNPKTILIVEDNEDMQNYLCKNLSDKYRVIVAANGEAGMQKAIGIQPDLILSDIMMPVLDGIQMTKALKDNTLTSHIPVLLLTAKAGEESKLEGLKVKADDYLTKPFSIKELNARIDAMIANREMLREKFIKTINLEPSEFTCTSMDAQFLQKALKIVEEHMGNSEFSVDDFCREISMSRTNVHLKLKALTDQSTTEFIRSIRLKRAAQMIKQDSGSVADIAFLTGFTSQQYFSRCFKEYFKVSPSEYT